MTIIEAVRSGRMFARMSWYFPLKWLSCSDGDIVWPNGKVPRLSREDILADDWEVKREKVKKTGWVLTTDIHKPGELLEYDGLGHLPKCVQVTYEVEE